VTDRIARVTFRNDRQDHRKPRRQWVVQIDIIDTDAIHQIDNRLVSCDERDCGLVGQKRDAVRKPGAKEAYAQIGSLDLAFDHERPQKVVAGNGTFDLRERVAHSRGAKILDANDSNAVAAALVVSIEEAVARQLGNASQMSGWLDSSGLQKPI
jgi:hypothetical protein